jgi:hypothetical protein
MLLGGLLPFTEDLIDENGVVVVVPVPTFSFLLREWHTTFPQPRFDWFRLFLMTSEEGL